MNVTPATGIQKVEISNTHEHYVFCLEMNEATRHTALRLYGGEQIGTYPDPCAALKDFFQMVRKRAGSTSFDLDVEIAGNMLSVEEVERCARQSIQLLSICTS